MCIRDSASTVLAARSPEPGYYLVSVYAFNMCCFSFGYSGPIGLAVIAHAVLRHAGGEGAANAMLPPLVYRRRLFSSPAVRESTNTARTSTYSAYEEAGCDSLGLVQLIGSLKLQASGEASARGLTLLAPSFTTLGPWRTVDPSVFPELQGGLECTVAHDAGGEGSPRGDNCVPLALIGLLCDRCPGRVPTLVADAQAGGGLSLIHI